MKHFIHNSIYLLLLTLIIFTGCKKNPSSVFNPIIERYVNIWNTGNFNGINEILDREFELKMAPTFKPEKGIELFKVQIQQTRTAYPDFNIVLNEIVYDKDKIAALWTIKATNTGMGGNPPTGKKVNIQGISIIHFKNGKILDEWIAYDTGYWLKQLGSQMAPSL